MKFSDFEGGTRVSSWVSGGVIPQSRRGTVHSQGLAHVCDWYSTFSTLAGVDPADDKASGHPGIPAIDSIDLWDAIASGTPTNRTTIVLSVAKGTQWDQVEGGGGSDEAIIVFPYKYVKGKQKGMGVWTGKVHPNATATLVDNDPGCPDGCIFNIESDPTEHINLAPAQPDLLQKLKAQLAKEAEGAYQTNDTPGYTKCENPAKVEADHQGFCFPPCTAGIE